MVIRLFFPLKVFRPLMNDPGDLDAVRADAIDKNLRIAGHHAFARPLAHTWTEYQTKCGDLLGLRLNGVDDVISDDIPSNFEVVFLNGFEIAPGANGVFKPLSWRGALSGVFRNAPASHRL